MIISIQRGMEGLKTYLQNRGFSVVYSDEFRHPSNTHIYSDFSHFSLADESRTFTNSIPLHRGSYYSATNNSHGAIEINAAGKSHVEIENMLLNRHSDILM